MATKRPPGKVYLIGAGPGDPGLMTLRGHDYIKIADVVVYDHLANPRLLADAKRGSEHIYVGKRSSQHTVDQGEINQLLLKRAQAGKIVARLKGGDSFIFGRGGEEALFLAENGVDFEIVPGVSSAYAVPAYAGIPVTYRGLASDVSFITGHEQQAKSGPGIAWELLARTEGTLVFLMGVKNLPEISTQLIKHGKAPTTPTAVIRWGTMAAQQTLVAPLQDIVARVREKDFRPPAVIVVGEVVGLRDKLAWFEKKPLFGLRVVVTRAARQAGALGQQLESAGAEVIDFPTISLRPVQDHSIIDQAVHDLQNKRVVFDWSIFTSANAIDYFISRLHHLNTDIRVLGRAKIACVGTATAERLSAYGLNADLIPADFRAEGLLKELEQSDLTDTQVLIPRALEARGILPERLRERGAKVTVAPVYENVIADTPADELKDDLRHGRIDYITFTSGSTVKNFAAMLSANGQLKTIIGRAKVAVIGPVTARSATRSGLQVDVMAPASTTSALVEAIIEDRVAEPQPESESQT